MIIFGIILAVIGYVTGIAILETLGGILVLVGVILWILGAVVYRIKHFIPIEALGRVYFWLGITLFVLSFYFAYGAIRFLVTGT